MISRHFVTDGLFFIQAMNKSDKNKFLIDGFPRNKNNLDGWNNIMTGKVDVMGVLFFDCPEDVREYFQIVLTSFY